MIEVDQGYMFVYEYRSDKGSSVKNDSVLTYIEPDETIKDTFDYKN